MCVLSRDLFFGSPAPAVDCSPPGSPVYWILQAKILEWVAFLLQGIFLTWGWNPGLLHCRQILYPLS